MFTQLLALFEGLSPTIKIIGIIVTILAGLSSIISSILNANIRTRTDAGEKIGTPLLVFASVLNFISANIDKGIQLARLAKGLPVAQTSPPAVITAGAVAPPTDPKPPAA